MNRIELARRLAELLDAGGPTGKWGGGIPTAEDGTVRVRMDYDCDYDLFREEDWFGRVEHRDYRDARSPRPEGFSGAARKIDARRGFFWWQPPADATEPAQVEAIYQRVRGYIHEEWSYTLLRVEYVGPACSHGFYPAPQYAVLGGVESDTSVEYLAELLGDMMSEVGIV